MKAETEALLTAMLAGSAAALAKLITLVESESPEVPDIIQRISPRLGKAYCIGITGAPGVGKSTLASALAGVSRSKGLTVGIVAADPSSVIHGGAVLGDRIRMQAHALDSEVFIRSMATRGSPVGLPACIRNVRHLLDAFGKDIIIVETVGVGQLDICVAQVADTVVLVMSPEYGDSIQLMKAGVIEIADVIVVNKADRGDAEGAIAALESVTGQSERNPAILATEAINNVGIEALFRELEQRRKA